MLFECCIKSIDSSDWASIDADSPTEAAEAYVEELCLYDAGLYDVFACGGEIVTVANGDAECEVRVIVDLEPTFWSEIVKD